MLPITKWTGSKRYQAPDIVGKFPKKINTYYEPFVGGGSVLCEYLNRLEQGNYKCNNIVISDTNTDLMNIYKFVKNDHLKFINKYIELYNEFSQLPPDNGRKEFYNKIRNTYNKLKLDNIYNDDRTVYFNWLMRTCFNGLIRYNKYGEFTTSCHYTRSGIKPDKFEKLITEWHVLLNKYNVQLLNISYQYLENIAKNDVIYCDPPYSISAGMYDHDQFNNEEFFDWLRQLPCKYLLSYDGTSGKVNNTYEMPSDLYDEHIYVDSSISAFKKLVNKEVVTVYDSLYIKEAKK